MTIENLKNEAIINKLQKPEISSKEQISKAIDQLSMIILSKV